MEIGIGIDSGGTFTDGVVVDLGAGKILSKVKVPTTHENLLLGIRECLKHLKLPPEQRIAVVSLSTTLATNAVVEGKGAKVGVILIGYEQKRDIPSPYCYFLKGGHDSLGNPLEELDLPKARSIIRDLKEKVDAFAISSIMSVRNPEHELAVKELIKEETDCPAICGYELTSVLGVHERAVTAVLNARLIPVIKQLIVAVKQVLEEEKIAAPLMLVRGDGSLVLAESALERPIETLLSGPAASIIGAKYLSGINDAIVVDMGGTTTDTALIDRGMPSINQEGALVGGWLTRVKAVSISTVGLGGDSYIQVDKKGCIKIGPRRVVPISSAALAFPNIKEELAELIKKDYLPVNHQPADMIALSSQTVHKDVFDKKLKEVLGNGPHTIWFVAHKLGQDPDLLPIKELENEGLIIRIALTPTDVLSSLGRYSLGDSEAALLGVRLLAKVLHQSPEQFYQLISREMSVHLMSILLDQVIGRNGLAKQGCHECPMILKNLFFENKDDFEIQVKLKKPVVAVGAPVKAYFPEVVSKLNGSLVIPEHAEVANAVGAVMGQIIEQVEVLIRPHPSSGYTIFAPWKRTDLPQANLEEVKETAKIEARKYVFQKALKAGGHNINVVIDMEDVKVHSVLSNDERYFIECKVKAKAIGNSYKSFLGTQNNSQYTNIRLTG